jgi:hypothetical protein
MRGRGTSFDSTMYKHYTPIMHLDHTTGTGSRTFSWFCIMALPFNILLLTFAPLCLYMNYEMKLAQSRDGLLSKENFGAN